MLLVDQMKPNVLLFWTLSEKQKTFVSKRLPLLPTDDRGPDPARARHRLGGEGQRDLLKEGPRSAGVDQNRVVEFLFNSLGL